MGGICMRHFYFRLILGIVFIDCMIFSFITMNIPFALLYLVLGIVFLASAYASPRPRYPLPEHADLYAAVL